jgi:hypothetical protein
METVQRSEHWQTLFENWPDAIPKNAQLVTRQGETIPFINFVVSGTLLLIERNGPDASGMRKVILDYDSIAMIKLGLTGDLSRFQCMGFQTAI